MMNNKIRISDRLLFIKFLLLVLFILDCSLLNVNENSTNFDYYESFSSPSECFHIFHDNPTGPGFLLIKIICDFVSTKSQRVTKSFTKKYQLKRTIIPCESSIILPTLGKGYVRMNLNVVFKLYYKEKAMARSTHNFQKGFNTSKLIIVTSKNNFGMLVKFSKSANKNSFKYDKNLSAVRSYLLSLRKNNGLVCLVTHNNQKLVLWQENLPIRMDIMIIRIKIEYVKNGNLVLKSDYPAFECREKRNRPMDRVKLINEVNNSDIVVSVVYANLDILKQGIITAETSFLNMEFVNVERMRTLQEYDKKLFLLKTHSESINCPNKGEIQILKSETNIAYQARSKKDVTVSHGITRRKYFYHPPESPCD